MGIHKFGSISVLGRHSSIVLNSYALVFNRPFFSNAAVEVNSISPVNIPFILNDPDQSSACDKGMAYAHITFFNDCDLACQRWFKEKGLKLFRFSTMGIIFDSKVCPGVN